MKNNWIVEESRPNVEKNIIEFSVCDRVLKQFRLGSIWVGRQGKSIVEVCGENWAATYVPRNAFLEFVEQLRARYVEHTCWADKLLSVVVIAVRLRVMTQVLFGIAGVGRTILRLFRACLHIRFHMWTRICYVTELLCIGENLWEHTCGFPGVFFISSVEKWDCTRFSCELGGTALSFSLSKNGWS